MESQHDTTRTIRNDGCHHCRHTSTRLQSHVTCLVPQALSSPRARCRHLCTAPVVSDFPSIFSLIVVCLCASLSFPFLSCASSMPATSSSTRRFRVRPAVEADAESILRLIRGLAEFEKAPEEVINTVEQLREDGWGKTPRFTVSQHSLHILHILPPNTLPEHILHIRHVGHGCTDNRYNSSTD